MGIYQTRLLLCEELITMIVTTLSTLMVVSPQRFYVYWPRQRSCGDRQCLKMLKVGWNYKETGVPNCQQARIPDESDLNIEQLETELKYYPDKLLIQYLRFGFPLKMGTSVELHSICHTPMVPQ